MWIVSLSTLACVCYVILGNSLVQGSTASRCYDCHYDPDSDKYRSDAWGQYPGYPKCAMYDSVEQGRVDRWQCSTGKCFIRKDPNGLLYRGCADPTNLPWGVDTSQNCEHQGQIPSLWYFCDGDLCNAGRLGAADICPDHYGNIDNDQYVETVHGPEDGNAFEDDIEYYADNEVPYQPIDNNYGGNGGDNFIDLSQPQLPQLPDEPRGIGFEYYSEQYMQQNHQNGYGNGGDQGSYQTGDMSIMGSYGNGQNDDKSEAPNKSGYSPPKKSYNPPKKSYTPPKKSYTPPKKSYTPPKKSYTPPKKSYTPPKKSSYIPPPKQPYQPPTQKGYEPAAKKPVSVPPKKPQYTPPTKPPTKTQPQKKPVYSQKSSAPKSEPESPKKSQYTPPQKKNSYSHPEKKSDQSDHFKSGSGKSQKQKSVHHVYGYHPAQYKSQQPQYKSAPQPQPKPQSNPQPQPKSEPPPKSQPHSKKSQQPHYKSEQSPTKSQQPHYKSEQPHYKSEQPKKSGSGYPPVLSGNGYGNQGDEFRTEHEKYPLDMYMSQTDYRQQQPMDSGAKSGYPDDDDNRFGINDKFMGSPDPQDDLPPYINEYGNQGYENENSGFQYGNQDYEEPVDYAYKDESLYNPCDGGCHNNPSGLYADPADPTRFIQCADGMELGQACRCCKPYFLKCPYQTTFDEQTRVCINAVEDPYYG